MKIFNVKRKKASLSLSLNAIVILVLAIAILGLGLTFIRGIFKGITAKVEEAVSAGEVTNPPNRDRPVTITPPTIELRVGQVGEVKIAFMNIQPSPETYTLSISGLPKADCPIEQMAATTCSAPIGGWCTSNSCECKFGDWKGLGGTNTNPCRVPLIFSTDSYYMQKDAINIWTVAINPVEYSLCDNPIDCTTNSVDRRTFLYTATFTETGGTQYSRDFIVKVER